MATDERWENLTIEMENLTGAMPADRDATVDEIMAQVRLIKDQRDFSADMCKSLQAENAQLREQLGLAWAAALEEAAQVADGFTDKVDMQFAIATQKIAREIAAQIRAKVTP